MSAPEKFVENAKRYAKKALVVFLGVLMVVYSSNISAFADAIAESIQAAAEVQDTPAETTAAEEVPVEQTVNEEGQTTTEPEVDATQVNEQYTLYISHSNATVYYDGAAVGDYITVSSNQDVWFTVAADNGYELESVTLDGAGVQQSGGSYVLWNGQFYNGARINVSTTQVQVETQNETSAATNIEETVEGSDDAEDDLAKADEATTDEAPAADATTDEAPAETDSADSTDAETPAEDATTDEQPAEEETPAVVDAGTVEVTADVSKPAFEGYAYVDDVTVKVTAAEGVLPEGTTVVARKVTSGAITGAVSSVLESQGQQLTEAVAIDVTLQDADGNEIQPNGAVNVCFFNSGVSGTELGVYRVADDASKVETIVSRQADAECASFDVDHFSVYVITNSTEATQADEGVNTDSTFISDIMVYSSKTELQNGQTATFDAKVYINGEKDPTEDPTYSGVSWSIVKGGEVANIDQTGLFTVTAAVTDATPVTVRATSTYNTEEYKDYYVTVNPTEVSSVSISGYTSEYLVKGNTAQLTANVLPEDASDRTITWTSSDEKVATVSADGVVTAVAQGNVTITATAKSGAYAEQAITVYNSEPKSVNIPIWVTNQDKSTNVSLNVPTDGSSISVDNLQASVTSGKKTYIFTGTVRYRTSTSKEWSDMQNFPEVKYLRYYNNQLQYSTDGSIWKSASASNIAAFYGERYGGDEKDTKVDVTTGDWPGSLSECGNHATKTINVNIINEETGNTVYSSGQMMFYYDKDAWIGKISFNCDQSLYDVDYYTVTRSTKSDGSNATDVTGNANYEQQASDGISVRFNGVTNSNASRNDTDTRYAEHYVVTAYVKAKTYTVNYDANGGTGAPTDDGKYRPAQKDTVTVSSTEPTREGYLFSGWVYNGTLYKAGDTITLDSMPKGGTLTLKAQWVSQSAVIQYKHEGGGYVTRASERISETTKLKDLRGSLAEPNTGYDFVGWFDENDNKVSDEAEFIPTELKGAIYTAKFEKQKFNINLKVVNGTITYGEQSTTDTATAQVEYNDTFNASWTPTDDNYELESVTVDGTDVTTAAEKGVQIQGVKKDYSVVVTYKLKTVDYTVKYVDESGKELATSKTGTGNVTDEVTESAIDIEGYTLKDSKKSSQTITLSKDGENVIEFVYRAKRGRVGYNLALEGASWNAAQAAAEKLTVTETSGTGSTKYYYNYGFVKGDTFVVTTNTPTADNNVFIGWFDKARTGQAAAIRETGSTLAYTYDEPKEGKSNDYTLDALWANLTATGVEHVYDGKGYSISSEIALNNSSLEQKYKDQAKALITEGTKTYKYRAQGSETWTDNGTENPAFTDTGVYEVEVSESVTVGGNTYTLSATATVTITKAPLTVVTESGTKVYDGEPLTAGGNITGFVTGETATFTVTGSQTAVGSSSNTYSLTWNGDAKESNYEITSETLGTLVVTESTENIVVSTTGGTYTYDGKAHAGEVVVSTLPKGYTLEKATTKATATDVTTEDVKVTVEELVIKNAQGEDVTSKLKITKSETGVIKVNPAPLTVTTDSATKVYDGTALTAGGKVEGFVNGETATFTVKGSQTEVGNSDNWYTIDWDGTAKQSNYSITENKGTLTVTQQTIEDSDKIAINDPSDHVYDGQEHKWSPTVTTADGKTTLVENTDYTVTYDTTDFKNVKTITVTITGKGNYTGTVTKTYEITKAPLTVNTESASKVYDGIALTAGGTITGFVEGETYDFKVTGTQTAVGSSNNTYSLSFSGSAKEGNYEIKTETIGTLTVSQYANEIVVTTTGGTWTYDGKAHGATVTVSELPKGYMVSVASSNATATDVTTEDVEATANTLVILNAALEPVTDQLNIKYVNGTIKINPAEITITTPDATKVYDGSALTAAGSIDGIVAGETYNFTTTGTRTDVGTSDNTYSMEWAAEGNDYTAKESNYKVIATTGKLTVTEQTITDTKKVTINDPSDSVYDGQEHKWTPTVTTADGKTTLVEGTDYTVTYDTEDFTDVKTITVTIKGTGNYSGEVTKTYKITPAPLTIETASATKVYDGSALTKTDEYTFSGLVNGENATFAVTGTQTKVGSSSNTYSLTWDGTAKKANYSITSEKLGTLTVTETEAEIVVTTTGGEFTYDGKAHGATVAVTGLPEGYTVQSAASSATATDVTTTDVAATADTLVIVNAEDEDVTSKLNITKVDGTIKVNPATLTITTPDANKVYDGTALTAAGSITGFVNGETATFKTTGSQTEKGSSKNSYSLTWDRTAKQSNYKLSETVGTLTVTDQSIVPGDENYDGVKINDPSNVTYDGQEHKWAPTVTNKNGETLTENVDYEVSYSRTFDAGDGEVDFKDIETITVTIKGKGNYSGTVTKTYKITPATLTLESNSFEKTYDGSALTNTGDLKVESGWVSGEGAKIEFTGSITLVGTIANAFNVKPNEGTKLSNYTVAKTEGTLTVKDDTSDDKVITKTDDGSGKQYALGETVTFTIEAKNIYNEAKEMVVTEQEGVIITEAEGATISEGGRTATFASVEAGATVIVTATHVITEADIVAGTYKNTATVTFGDKSFSGDDEVDPEDKNAHLTVTKTTTNNPDETKIFQVGEDIEYEVVVENDGNVTISNVTIDDQLEGVELVSDTGETELAPGEKRTATYKYTVKQSDVDAGKSIVNNATADGTDPDGDKPDVVPDETTDSIPAQEAWVGGTKRAVKEDGTRATGLTTGDTAYWTVTLTNSGNVTLSNIFFNEIKDLDVISATDANGNAVSFTNSDAKNTQYTSYVRTATLDPSFKLAPGESVVVKYEAYTITEADVNEKAVRNIVNAGGHYTTAKGQDKTKAANISGNIYTKGNASFKITKVETDENGVALTESKTYKLGDTIYYKLVVENNGNFDLTNLVITDANAGITEENAFTKDKLARGTSWNIPTVLEHVVTEDDILAGKVENTAAGTAKSGSIKTPEPTATSNTVVSTTDVAKPELTVTKSSADDSKTYAAGDTIEYTIKVENTGNLTISGITVTDELTGNGADNPLATGLTLKPGESKEYKASYTVTESDTLKGTTIKNVAVAKGTDPTGKETEGKGDHDNTNVEGTYTLGVDKSVTNQGTGENGAFKLGDTIEYQIVVTNTGNTTLKDVTVTDSLTGEKWTIEGEFAPNANETFTTSYKVTNQDIINRNIKNTATATGTTVAEPTKTAEGSDDATVGDDGDDGDIVENKSHYTIVKETTNKAEATGEDGKFATGDVIKYRITVTNDGTLSLTNVVVTDALTGDEWTVVTEGYEETGEFMPGDTQTFEAEHEVTDADVIRGHVLNEATGTGTSPDPDVDPTPDPGTDDEETEDLKTGFSVVKTVTSIPAGGIGAAYRPGETITYRIVVTNTGNVTAKNVTVTDALTGDTWAIDELAPGIASSREFTATHVVTEAEGAAGTVTNVATATGTIDNPDDPSNPTPIEPGTGSVDSTTEPTPVTPVVPDGPAPADGGDTPAPVVPADLPAPVAAVAEALAAAAGAEAVTAAEVIADEGTPLANAEHFCWVHRYIIIGIVVTAIYVAAVIIRRVRFGQKVHDYDDDTLNKGKKGSGETSVEAPTTNLGVQPTMAQGTEA